MFLRGVILPLLVSLGVFLQPGGTAEPVGKVDAVRIARFIEQLGSEQFAEREAAMKALDEIGPLALEALKKATASSDGEVVRRAHELVERLERRVETTRALEAPKLRLVYNDLPLPDAIADFAKKTGFPVQVDEKEKAALAKRQLTLDTGEVSFWEAYEMLCEKAGLVERPSAQLPYSGTSDTYGAYLWKSGYASSYPPAPDSKFFLIEGKRPLAPTHLAGTLRIQAPPSKGPVPGASPRDGEALFPLEVSSAPGLDLQEVVSLRVHRAVDTKGQALTQPGAFLGSENISHIGAYETIVIVDGMTEMSGTPRLSRQQIPLRLQVGSQRSQRIQELHGTFAAVVLTPPKPILTLDNIMKSAGQTAKGTDGGLLKVLDAKDDHGKVTLQVHLDVPPDNSGLWSPAGVAATRKRAIVIRNMMVANQNGSLYTLPRDLSLLDTRGQVIPPHEVKQLPGNDGKSFEMTYLLQKGQEPSQMIYTARRRVLVEVPFTLKDIPLP